MPLYEAVLKYRAAGQNMVNRWNYQAPSAPTGATGSFALATVMGFVAAGDPPAYPDVTVFHRMRLLQHADVRFTEIIVKEIYTPTDFYTASFPTDLGGLGSGGNMASPFMALGFRTSLVRTDIDRGTKRVGGFPAGFLAANGVIGSETLTAMQSLATLMQTPLVYTVGDNNITYTPVIVKKEKYTVPSSGKKAYRYYKPESAQTPFLAIGFTWQPYSTVRSQTSRQVGHGS